MINVSGKMRGRGRYKKNLIEIYKDLNTLNIIKHMVFYISQ